MYAWYKRIGVLLSTLLVLLPGLSLHLSQPVRAAQSLTAIAHWSQPLREPLRDLLPGDVDGDGQREVVVVGRNGYLALLEADGKLVWQKQLGEETYAACLADLDGDSAEDVLIGGPRGVTALGGDGKLLWFYRTGHGVDTVCVTDTNGDGRNEVVAATSFEHVYQLTADGQRIWHYWPQRQGFGGTMRGLAIANFDDDYEKEVAVAFDFPGYKALQPAGRIRLLDHDGTQLWLRQTESAVLSITAVDPDGWGKYLIAAGTAAGEFIVLFGDNSMRWEHELGSPVLRLLSGDIDNDQRDELVAVAERRMLALDDDGSLLWERSAAAASGITSPAGRDASGLQRVVDATLGDLEGSAGRSVAVLSLSTGEIVSTPSETEEGQPQVEGALLGPRKNTVELIDIRGGTEESYLLPSTSSLVRLSDLNMDGWAELLVASNESVQLLARAHGAAHSRLTWSYQMQGEITALDAADVDADGRFEVLVGSQDQNLYVLKDDGSLSWRYPAPGVVRTINTGDVDSDGQREVIVGYNKFDQNGDPQGWGLSVLRGDGRVLWQYQMDNWLWCASTADLNGDGEQEVVVGTSSNQVSAISDGHLLWSYPTAGSVVNLYAADLNESGRAGVLAGSEDNHAYVLFGNGMLRWSYDTGRNVSAVCAADLNGDGLGEIFIASEQGVLYALRLDGVVLWRNDLRDTLLALYAGDLNSDGHVYVATGTQGGELYLLGANGLPVWQYTVPGRLLSICPGDVDGDRYTEIVAGSMEGLLYIVTQGGKLEGRHELGGGVGALWAGDLDGDGRAEILAGTREGRVAMYEHTANRPPLVANPSVTRSEAGYVYSVSINDPENDKVEVALEVFEPFSGAWRSAETRYATKPDVLYWFADSFPFLASGRTAAYRMTYSDGLNTGVIGPLPGPRVPGIPWYTYAGVPVVVGLLLLGYRGWRKSPARYARLLYARLAEYPEEALDAMRELAVHGVSTTEILIRLSQRARAANNQIVASLADGYLLLSSRPATGLQIIASALAHSGEAPSEDEQMASGHSSRIGTLVQVYELLADLLEANTVAHITVLRPRIQHVLRLLEVQTIDNAQSRRVAVEKHATPLDEIRHALDQFWRVAGLVRNSERAEATEDKLDYLMQAFEVLAVLANPAQLKHTRREKAGPEVQMISQIAVTWQRVIAAAREEWLGRAQLRCRLRTRRIMATGEALLLLEVQNRGRSPALQTTVELAGDGAGTLLGSPVALGTLPPGHAREARLRLLPPQGDQFRVEFVLRYDDREATGKSQRFADMVEVLTPSEFHFIPNPYVPGRPLGPASPVFYGREDVFEFIAKNARGLLQRNILILIGQRRTGKTSMLLQLPLRLDKHYVAVYLDCQSLGLTPGLSSWLYDVATAIAEGLAAYDLHIPVPELAAFEKQPAHVFEHGYLDLVQDALGDRTLLLVLDEFEELEMRVRAGLLDPTVFPYLRHLMQHTRRAAFVFVGTHRLEEMTTDYWSVLFNIALYRHIGFLDESSAQRLITEPVRAHNMVYDDLALYRMLQVTAGHPYFLQLLCYSLVNAHNRNQRSYTTVDDVDQALEEILTLGSAHFSFLWETSSEQERATLLALTRLLPRLGQATWPQLGATASDVALLLAEQGLTLDPREVSTALRRLAAREILQQVPDDVERYVFKVGLVALWIERYRSLQKLIEEFA